MITIANAATGENEDTAEFAEPLDVDIGHNTVVHFLVWNSVLTKALETFKKNQVTLNIFTEPGFLNATCTYV